MTWTESAAGLGRGVFCSVGGGTAPAPMAKDTGEVTRVVKAAAGCNLGYFLVCAGEKLGRALKAKLADICHRRDAQNGAEAAQALTFADGGA